MAKKIKKKIQPAKQPVIGPEKQQVVLYPQAGDNNQFIEQLENLKKVGPGGAREGAGRKPGSTKEVLAAEKMGSVANPAITGLLQIPFEVWAQITKIASLALTDKEAELLSLPATQLVNFYLPAVDNPIYLVWASLVGTASYIMLPRLYEFKKLRDEKEKLAGDKIPGKDSSVVTDGDVAGQHLAPAGPADGINFPKDKDIKPIEIKT